MGTLRRKEVLLPLLIIFVCLFVLSSGNIVALYCNERGVRHLRSGDFAQAKRLFELAIRADPDFQVAYYNLGLIYKLEDKLSKAMELFEKALNIYPNFYMARLDLAKILLEQGEYARAREVLKGVPLNSEFRDDVVTLLLQIREASR